MSHIVKGKVSVSYTDLDVLVKALSGLGEVRENEKLYRVGVGYTDERYSLVLVDAQDHQRRIGFRLEGAVFNQYQEDYGSYGAWTAQTSNKIVDRYLAYHYEKQLKAENYNVTVMTQADGTLEVVAEEVVW
ncbi:MULTISPECIES: hypothetical protein [Pseudomonas]|jgi:hypothetical protein|uniref:DUF1257 domain-containing protein n=1 Tax=Pseudomonas shahriarae TaxID=2745512 RepID=A0A9X4C7W7_9PSED|nr:MULTISPECIES: hypothetical protein [Pseudomonas]MDD1011936.1 hypothetical protein [Pseudomonas shahriarae]POA78589.1 hypothetical protein C1890_09640 [Pseudomonas sp. DP16D-R1]